MEREIEKGNRKIKRKGLYDKNMGPSSYDGFSSFHHTISHSQNTNAPRRFKSSINVKITQIKWNTTTCHPTSKQTFIDQQIVSYAKCKP